MTWDNDLEIKLTTPDAALKPPPVLREIERVACDLTPDLRRRILFTITAEEAAEIQWYLEQTSALYLKFSAYPRPMLAYMDIRLAIVDDDDPM